MLITLVACFVAMGGLGFALQAATEEPSPPSSRAPAPTQPASSSPPAGQPANPQPSAPDTTTAPRKATVVRIIDGDTLDVRGDGHVLPAGEVVRVRLLAIDAPEKGACFAQQATARLTALLPPGSALRYERDVDLKDPYDRYLLYLFNQQDVFVNASLVESGHAKAKLYPPNDARWPEINRDGKAAENTATGLWAACPESKPNPPDKPDPAPQPVQPETPDPDNPAGLPPGPPATAPDVDCGDIPNPVWVGPNDPHRLDADGDGIGCNSS